MRGKLLLIRALKIISLITVLQVFILLSQTYFFRINNRDSLRVDGFRLEEKDSLDVMLIGSSEIYTDFSSAYAYDLYGFTSYPYAVAAAPVTLWKTMLEDSLSRQTPQLIVVEINGAVYLDPTQLHRNSAMHYIMDRMPLSINKVQTIRNLCNNDTDPMICFYLPIIKYHSNWTNGSDLAANYNNVHCMQKRGHTLLRGVSSTPVVSSVTDAVRNVTDDYSESALAEEAELYLREFLAYCKNRELNVVFVNFPHRIDSDSMYRCFTAANQAGRIVEEYGYPYLNLCRNQAEIGIDLGNDYYNSNHLNIFGQRKFTEFFSHFLVNDCGVVPSALSKETEDGWKESAEYYKLYCQYVESRMSSGSTSAIAETAGLVSKLENMKSSEGNDNQ